MNTHDIDIELPPLPKFDRLSSMHADDVANLLHKYGRECARAAIEADRKHYQEIIEALEKEIESLAFNGSGLLAENKKLKTELKRRGISNECEPVAWEYPSDEWVKAFFGEPDESGFYYFRGDFGNIAYRYYKAARATAPQPAEPTDKDSLSVAAPVACFKCGQTKHDGECVNVAPQPAEPVKIPSDEELLDIFYEVDSSRNLELGDFALWKAFARALLERYGQTTDPTHK